MKLFPTAVIGSLPRPTFVRELAVPENESLAYQEQEHFLEAAIRYAVALQESADIDTITDGEWRRVTFFDVLTKISDGFSLAHDPLTPKLQTFFVTNHLHLKSPGFLAREVAFLRSITSHPIKTTLPSPALLGERMWHPEKSKDAYPTRRAFVEACIPLLRKELLLAIQAGATTVQIDDPYLCLFVDENVRKKYDHPEHEVDTAVAMINELTKGLDIRIGVHLCRRAGARTVGACNFSGTFDFLVPYLNNLHVQELALEFTAPVAGDTSVLRKLRPDFQIGLGCLSVHQGQIDSVEAIAARAEEAVHHIDADRITLTPDCGFSPSSSMNVSLDEVYQKLQNLSEAARILRKKYS